MSANVDPASPVPLYHQIAEAIRSSIACGDLKPGDALDPMRQAAERWGVNLHTVRHAYAALAREGLLEMRAARGTRVTGEAVNLRRSGQEDVGVFVGRVVKEAAEQHSLSAAELAARVAAHGKQRHSMVTVVECNAWQCQAHADEITQRWQVDTKAWPLTEAREPVGETVITTYFHYNDIRRRWPHLLNQVKFLTVRVDEQLINWLSSADEAVVIERDEPTAEAVAADIRAVLGEQIELRIMVSDDPASAIKDQSCEHVLCSPRVWSELDESVRAISSCAVVRYRFDENELETLARNLAWQPVNTKVESL